MSKPDAPTDVNSPTDPDPQPETLPVLKEDTRPYIRVRPTEDSLSLGTVRTHFRRLHQLNISDPNQRWYQRLLRSESPPIIECLLVSEGNDHARLNYYFGVDDSEGINALERVLRGLFPNAYELEQVTLNPDQLVSTETPDTDDREFAAVEFLGRAERRNDWQTCLTPFSAFLEDDNERVPLAAVVELMAESDDRVVYQALLHPRPDWSGILENRRASIEASQDTVRDQVTNVFLGPPEKDSEALPSGDEERLEELEEKDARNSFDVNARALVVSANDSTETPRTAHEIATALTEITRTCYHIEGRVSLGTDAKRVRDAIRDRTFHSPNYQRLSTRVPWKKNTSPGIVADASEAPNFCLLGGDGLTAAGGRALAPTPGERTSLPRPPFELLSAYRAPGLTLGLPLTQDGTPDDEPLSVPPSLQPMHVAWFGKTGSGKSTSAYTAILDNHVATDGPDILLDTKGDGMGRDYLRSHYARFGHLDNVLYFDCSEVLPAFSFFDIRDELEAGIPRTTAVEDKVDHYIEILMQIMGRDRFEQAVRSPDVIRYLVKAAFDPINGDPAFSHRELHAGTRQMHERQSAPPVSDPDLEQALGGVVANRARTFDEIMAGVANRMEKIPVDQRLARIFNHVPEDEEDPHFDLADYLNEDVVIIFDTGGLRSEAQRVLSLVIISNLWTALRRRKGRDSNRSHPLVNLYIEEAASVAVSDLLKTLLAQARGFDCSVTLSMQFPAQLRQADETAYDEVLNNVSTFVTGNVPVDRRLAERLATDDMDARAVGNRLRALRRGQWLVSLPAAFDEPEPRPFLVGSMAPPPGDLAGPNPLSAFEQRVFEEEEAAVRERTLRKAGLTLVSPSAAQPDGENDAGEAPDIRVDSALPHTKRMPPTVEYVGSIHALKCTKCDNRYDPSIEGMVRAIECCSSVDEVDSADVPICDLNLKLTSEEIAVSEWTVTQLLFLQAVYNAQQLRYDPREYDLCHDSMIRLQEYVGIESGEIEDLIDAGLLRHDTDHPHRLFTVTPDGRKEIGEAYRQGVDYGHGAGDLEESSEHVFAVEVARQYLERQYVEDPKSPVVEVVPYYDIDEKRRLDIAGLDAEGEIVVTVEAERVNHDVRRAVPDDFDKMASCDPSEAIWVVMTRKDGHEVLEALNHPHDGVPRVEKRYAKTTPLQQFSIDTPGLTAIYPVEYVRDTLFGS